MAAMPEMEKRAQLVRLIATRDLVPEEMAALRAKEGVAATVVPVAPVRHSYSYR
ncbi:hypothetical protein [Bradyrhizobium sp. CW4]|nr:hypothetical protein [Bradyrhizobium sp. CW4]